MRFVWVGLGGAAGSMARYAIGLVVVQQRFPWATLGINLAGSFLLGFLLTLLADRVPAAVLTPIAVGVLGGFTTFSTFSWDTVSLGRTGQFPAAAGYVAASVLGGIAAAWLGYVAGRALR